MEISMKKQAPSSQFNINSFFSSFLFLFKPPTPFDSPSLFILEQALWTGEGQ